jgi:esterase FrsA
MAYTYAIDPQAMFEDRTSQFVSFGLSLSDVTRVRDAVTDMWANEPGGRVYEWSELARRYADQDEHFLASLAYGCAKFPCLADSAKADALALQAREYVASAPTFPVRFERRGLSLAYGGATIDVPVHLLSTAGTYGQRPVLIASGGVDTWKMDSHSMFLAFAQNAGVTVLGFDHPGTGETTSVPLNAAGDEVILGLVAKARALGDGRVAHFGMSFGANFSAMTGLSEAVDAAIVLGAPMEHAMSESTVESLPFGMGGILGNAFGFDHPPTLDEFKASMLQLTRHELLQRPSNAPMLVINGADDYFVPQADTLAFEGRPHTQVQLIPGTGHCAISKLSEVLPTMIGWLRGQLSQAGVG